MKKTFPKGHDFNSKHWQDYKRNLPPINGQLFEIALGMALGDASLPRAGREAHIKFEQGYKQKEFLYHLFHLFKGYCFMKNPGSRRQLSGPRVGEVKSYWFKTFSHADFTPLRNSLYLDGRKRIEEGFLSEQLSPRGLAYWVMCDGSLHREGKILTLHSQSFTEGENQLISAVINKKWDLSSQCIPHKKKYYVVQFPGRDAPLLRQMLIPHLVPTMMYKLPR